MTAVLDRHRARYPLLAAADLYKLIHQSVFGPGHIITSAGAARDYLVKEMAGLVPCPADEAEIEDIDPAGLLVRVNLRPIAGRAGVVDRLTAVLVESANTVRGTPDEMQARLDAAIVWCRTNLPPESAPLAELARAGAAAGFPARHHSELYVEKYRPAYRVVRLDLWRAA